MDRFAAQCDRRRRCRLLIVDDQALLREGLKALFDADGRHEVAADAATAREACHAVKSRPIEIAFVDALLPDVTAEEATRQLIAVRHTIRVIHLDESVSILRVRAALRAGAAGYLVKDEPFREILAGVERIAAGGTAFCQQVALRLVVTRRGLRLDGAAAGNTLDRLTVRELQVLEQLARGRSVKQAAAKLGIAANTVDNHKARLMRKLGVHKAADLIRLALREGLLGG